MRFICFTLRPLTPTYFGNTQLTLKAALDDEEFNLDGDIAGLDEPVEAPAAVSVPAPVAAAATAPAPTPAPAPTATETTAAALPANKATAATESKVAVTAGATPSVAATVAAAAAGVDEKLLQRAERFGIPPVPAAATAIEESKKAQRAQRFGLPEKSNSAPDAPKGGAGAPAGVSGKKGKASAAPPVVSDPELLAKMQARANRFGAVVSKSLQQTLAEQQKEEERLKQAQIKAAEVIT